MSNDIDAFFDEVEGGPSFPRTAASGSAGHGELDEFFVDPTAVPDAPADDLLNRISTFLTQHNTQLHEMRVTLSDTTTEAWNDESTPTITINSEPTDGIPILAMINTPNQQFNKLTSVFAYLCEEIRTLQQVAEKKFYAPLTMFGHEFNQSATKAATEGAEDPAGAGATPNTNALPAGAGQQMTPEMEMGAFLPLLQDLQNFIRRLYSIARNLINQLACLYHERQKLWMSTFKYISLELPFQCLSELATILITLDTIILDNPNIHISWQQFKRMIKYIRVDPVKYGLNDQVKLRVFEQMLLSLDRLVLNGNMYQTLLDMDYSLNTDAVGGGANVPPATPSNAQQQNGAPPPINALVSGNKVLYDTLTTFIKSWYKRLTLGINDSLAAGASMETYERIHLVELYSLYGLYRSLFKATIKPDKSLFTELWTLQKRIPIIHIFGRACWFVADFLGKYAPIDTKNLVPSGKQIITMRTDLLNQSDDTFALRCEELYNQLCIWLVRIESELAPSAQHNISTVLNARSKLLLNGILLSNQIRNLLSVNLFSHLNLRESFRSKNIRSYSICFEMLKTIEQTFSKRSTMLHEQMNHMYGQTGFLLKKLLIPIKRKLEKIMEKERLDDAKSDILSSINLTLSLLDQPPTRQRILLLKFLSSIIQFQGLLKDTYINELKYQLWKYELLSQYQSIVKKNCNCSFLYWISNLVPAIFIDIYNLISDSNQVHRLQYLFNAFLDCEKTLFPVGVSAMNAVVSVGSDASSGSAAASNPGIDSYTQTKTLMLYNEYKSEILSHFTINILTPLCREVENDLRLHIHSVVLEQANLRGNLHKIKDLSKFLNLKPLHCFNLIIDIKQRVTHYLDSIFYNLNTVSLHDWRIYAEMRNLAHEKYGLEMTEVHLPGTAHYSEALDVLEIMRNIHIFVARYNYNMCTQIFIERAWDQKHISSINIYHISDSLRTHGTGISNTTVNYSYQFLRLKFKIISEALFDDHIKSRLIKQIRFFKQEKEKLHQKYPYDLAEKFRQDIKKLGVAEDGTTFLDQFRKQITEIGNVLGYVRMVRSGGLHHVSASIKFVPDLEAIPKFQENCVKEGLSQETIDAAGNLDRVLADLTENFTDGSNYFSELVKVFQPVLNHPAQIHLKNFYMIIPALTLNFVDKMQIQKEKLRAAAGRHESSFTDDGFALGLAYILRILDQNDLYSSLHWFESVQAYIAQKRGEGQAASQKLLLQQKNTKKSSSSKQSKEDAAASKQTLEDDILQQQVNLKRIHSLQVEFDLFFFSFSGATIFFQDTSPVGGVDGKKKEEEEKKGENGTTDPGAATAQNGDAAAASVPVPPMDASVPMAPPMDDDF